MNAMIYIRGNRADYDEWRDSYGATGWGYDDVLPYFKKVRGQHPARRPVPRHRRTAARRGPPLQPRAQPRVHRVGRVAAGLKRNDDFNGAEQEGVGLYQVTCKKGRRWSVADAYIHPAATRPNLTVRTEAFVTRIVLEGTRATGVDLPRAAASTSSARARRRGRPQSAAPSTARSC